MRKIFVPGMIVLWAATAALLPLKPVSAARAQQEGTPLELDTWVDGTINAAQIEQLYIFEGKAGDIMLVQMLEKPGTYDLDPAVKVLDSAGAVLADANDTVGLNAVVPLELPADDTYTVVATRSGGRDGTSDGEYLLRVGKVVPLKPGDDSVEATIYSVSEKDIPSFFVLHPEADSTWSISFSQPESELHPELSLRQIVYDEYLDGLAGVIVFDLLNSTGIRSAAFNADLVGGEFYVLSTQQEFLSFVMDDISVTLTITIGEAG